MLYNRELIIYMLYRLYLYNYKIKMINLYIYNLYQVKYLHNPQLIHCL